MVKHQLSQGSLLEICKGVQVDKPILQVLGFKKIVGNNSDRYRVFISDGKFSNSFSMLATQLNDKITSGQMEANSIIRADRYLCNNMQNKKVIILLEIEVLATGEEVGAKIGEPVQINADGTVSQASANPGPVKRPSTDELRSPAPKRQPLSSSNNRPTPRSSILDPKPVLGSSNIDPSQIHVVPIASVNPYQNNWTIKVRVTHKSDIRRWSNARGEGHLFSMDLIDESGEIKATAFKEQCDKFYNLVEVNKLYYITSCSVKAANKQYSTLKNEYELSFRDNTEVIPCSDDSAIPTLSFDFVKIGDLGQVEKDSLVDIIGICKTSSDATTITSQRTQKELVKRDVVLVDKSLNEVGLTLWGTNAETFDPTDNPVVAVKGAKVSDYNGVSLSLLSSSVFQINPDMPQSHLLRGWYDAEGSNLKTNSLTQSNANRKGPETISKTLGDVKVDKVGYETVGKREYYSTSGYITMFMKDKALYQGCNNMIDGKTCNKKVIDQNDGTYRCEKCNLDREEFSWRLILKLCITDMTDNIWATCFQESAEQILGISAEDLGILYKTNDEEYNKVFQKSVYKRFNFRMSCRVENYNEESRVNHAISAVMPFDIEEESKKMAKELEENGIEVPSY